MLVLRRKEGDWITITHKSGDEIRVRTCNIRARYPGQLDLAFDDEARNFSIQRAERVAGRTVSADTVDDAVGNR